MRLKTIQTKGLEFIEFAVGHSRKLEECLEQLGFAKVGVHKHKDVLLYQQNHINLIVNRGTEPCWASRFAEEHGPSAYALAFRVADVSEALNTAESLGLKLVEEKVGPMELNIPAIQGVGGGLIYLVDRYGKHTIYDVDFDLDQEKFNRVSGCLDRIDHITQNVAAGGLDEHVAYYKRVFGFEELQHFDIRGEHSGLRSTALTSPDGLIKIPLNEPTDEKSQIKEFLDEFHGNGIQHIALHSKNIFSSVDRYRATGGTFQETPDSYYDRLADRTSCKISEVETLRASRVLLDGNPAAGFLMQIFTHNVIGPMFFELIHRKGNHGFGEGNFQALFESIEREQISRGVFHAVH